MNTIIFKKLLNDLLTADTVSDKIVINQTYDIKVIWADELKVYFDESLVLSIKGAVILKGGSFVDYITLVIEDHLLRLEDGQTFKPTF
jgi:hypothetical protein